MSRFLPPLLAGLLVLTGCVTTAPTPSADTPTPTATTTSTATPESTAPEPAAPPPANATPAPAPSTAATPSPATPAPAIPALELPPASIRGSEETSRLLDNYTAYLVAIDGAPVSGGREAWNKPLPLKPGPHRVGLAFARGVFAARAEVEFTATSRAAYQVKFATDAEFLGKNTYCEFWIVDLATGQPASDKVRVPLQRAEGSN